MTMLDGELGQDQPQWKVVYTVAVYVKASDEIEARELADYEMHDLMRRKRASIGIPHLQNTEPL